MFDFAWSEIGLIGVVALILIGPKDMPVAIKTVSDLVKKARRMAGEFQTHVDEMVREADLHEVRDHLRDIRSFDIKGAITKAVDQDGTLRKAFTDDPFHPAPDAGSAMATAGSRLTGADAIEAPMVETQVIDVHGAHAIGELPAMPAFIPPEAAAARPVPLGPPAPPAAPAFIPPEIVQAQPGSTPRG